MITRFRGWGSKNFLKSFYTIETQGSCTPLNDPGSLTHKSTIFIIISIDLVPVQKNFYMFFGVDFE